LDENAAYETARGYIGEVFTAAGEAYGLAVSRCLGSMESSMKSLEDVTFKNKAHSGIVCLLEKNFEVLRASLYHFYLARHISIIRYFTDVRVGFCRYKLLSKPSTPDLSSPEYPI
jgi:hypothetical protein